MATIDEKSPLTPAEQGAAFAAAVKRSGIQVDFGELREQAQADYWTRQAQTCMGPDWDGQNADVQKFVDSIGLTPGQTVEQTYDVHSDAFIYTGGEQYSNRGALLTDEAFVYQDAPTPGAPTESGWATIHGAPRSFAFGGCTVGVRTHAEMIVHPDYLELIDVFFDIDAVDANGKAQSVRRYSRWAAGILVMGNHPVPSPLTCTPEYCFRPMKDRLRVYFRTTLIIRYTGTAYNPIPYDRDESMPLDGRFYSVDLEVPGMTPGGTQTVRFTMPGGGGGGGTNWAERYTLRFSARAGASGTHGDPYTGQFAVPSPRTEVPSYGSGGYGGHGGGGGAGGATTIIRRFASDKAETIEQSPQTRPHGYASPGGQAGPGGDGCILIFW